MPRPSPCPETPFERISRLISLLVLAPLLFILSLPVAVDLPHRADLGFTASNLVVRSVEAGGPAAAAGMEPGQHIVAVAGQPTHHESAFYAARARLRPHAPITISVAAPGAPVRHMELRPVRIAQADLIHAYSLWVAGLAFLLIGWWVLWRRPDPVARNFHFLCLVFAFFLLDIPDHPDLDYMQFKQYLRALLQLLMPAFFLRFLIQFPSTGAPWRRTQRRYRILLLPGVVLFVASAGLEAFGRPPATDRIEDLVNLLSVFYALGYFVAGLAIFGRRVLRRERPIQQTKLKVVLVGLVGGLVPFLVATVVANVVPGTPLPYWQYLSLSLLLVPVSFALAIMRYGALDTRFVVRIGLVYGSLTLLVVLIYFVVVGLVGNLMARMFGAETWPVLVAIAAGSGLVIMPLRNQVQIWIDRTFYPSRRADRRAINALAERLTGLIEPGAVVRTIEGRLCELYRPEGFALFLPTPSPGAGFAARVGGCSELGTPPTDVFLAADSTLALLLDRLRRPVFREEIEDHMLATGADAESLQLLTRLRLALLVPLITGNRLLGIMGFGPKSSGDLYSQDDLANLKNLAVQAASIVESRQLYQASLERKRLETELEVARDIQANLLPDKPLDFASYRICGHNEPCRMVGGDYFDYFTLENDDLIFAIADVSGKGIPAALMMTSVRVAFRQEALPGVSPRDLMTRLNAVVTALGSQGHFICFFCGVLTPSTGLLRFCNAGMEQPVLFRPRSRYRQVLKKGGPVLGVSPEAVYREGAIGLCPGDRLFLYTDGLTEERNEQDEFLDAPRLLDVVEAHIDDVPETLLGKVFAHVQAFGGSNRSDDRTAILLEISDL
ncbi:SpoIIE family protein phosphatase [bacterium]|nr:SpoIIE family protein phosphatase [bacterium]